MLGVVRWHVGTDNRWATFWQNVEQDNRIPIIISADQTSRLVGSWKKAVEVAACVLSRRNL